MHWQKRYIVILLLFILFLSVGTAWQSGGTQIVHYVIGSGGGTLENGSTTIHGTIGQPVAGWVSGGSSEICSGFWCVAQPEPTLTPTPTPTATVSPTPQAIYLPVTVKNE